MEILMQSYVIGQAVEISAELRDRTDTLVDASAVRLLVIAPTDPTPTVVSLTAVETGVVRATITPDETGIWRYRFETISGVSAVKEGSFTVTARIVPAP